MRLTLAILAMVATQGTAAEINLAHGITVAAPGYVADDPRGTTVPDAVINYWARGAKPRALHMMIRASDLDRAVPLTALCPWQPYKRAVMMAEHVECPRLTAAKEALDQMLASPLHSFSNTPAGGARALRTTESQN